MSLDVVAGWRAGKAAWPGVEVSAEDYAAYLAEHLADGDEPAASRKRA